MPSTTASPSSRSSSRRRTARSLYAAADTQNVRRRLEAEKEQASSYAAAQFARDMLAIKDHLDRALAAVNDELRADKVASQFLAGIESTSRELDQVFARHGVSRIKSVGEKLDPHRHQAMVEMPERPGAGDDRRGNAGRLHDEGPAASPGARRGGEKAGLMHFAVVGFGFGGEAEPRLRLD